MIPVLGYSLLYFFDMIGLAATLYAVIRLPSLVPEHDPDKPRPVAGFKSVVEGLMYLRGHPVLLASFVVDLIAMIFGMPRALFPEIAHDSFGGPATGGFAFALLMAAIPAGAVIGGVFSGWVTRIDRQGLAVIICILIWGLSIVVAGCALFFADGTPFPVLPVVVGALMVGGAADMASAAFRQTMLQAAAADEVRGRLQGVFIVVVAGGPRIADVTHGFAAAAAGTAVATAGGGVGVIVLTVVAAFAFPAFIRYRALRERPIDT